MIIDQASYDSYKSMDHKLIVNILESSVSFYDVSDEYYWDWNQGPMPWEGGDC